MAKKNDDAQWLNIMRPHLDRMVNSPVYCRKCGAPLFPHQEEVPDLAIRTQMHFACLQVYKAELERKRYEEWKKQQKDGGSNA